MVNKVESNPKGRFLGFNQFKVDHLAIGKTPQDVLSSYDESVKKGYSKKKWYGIFPLWSEAGLEVNKITSPNALKSKEIASYFSSLVSIIGGLYFFSQGLSVAQELSIPLGATMSTIGLLFVSAMPVIGFRAGRIYNQMHSWMKKYSPDEAYFGQQSWNQGGK